MMQVICREIMIYLYGGFPKKGVPPKNNPFLIWDSPGCSIIISPILGIPMTMEQPNINLCPADASCQWPFFWNRLIGGSYHIFSVDVRGDTVDIPPKYMAKHMVLTQPPFQDLRILGHSLKIMGFFLEIHRAGQDFPREKRRCSQDLSSLQVHWSDGSDPRKSRHIQNRDPCSSGSWQRYAKYCEVVQICIELYRYF